eukprot:30865-Pelagococcus_subviridis.AAC.2
MPMPNCKQCFSAGSLALRTTPASSFADMCTKPSGRSSAAAYAIKSIAVRRVCRRDDTNTSVGFSGECVRIAAYVGLFIVIIRGQ